MSLNLLMTPWPSRDESADRDEATNLLICYKDSRLSVKVNEAEETVVEGGQRVATYPSLSTAFNMRVGNTQRETPRFPGESDEISRPAVTDGMQPSGISSSFVLNLHNTLGH